MQALNLLAERIDEVEATQRRIVDMIVRLTDILARTIDTETTHDR